MKLFHYTKLSTILVTMIFVGCMSQTPYLDANWGKSSTTAKISQMKNPDAAENMTPHEGISGNVSENISNKYDNSFNVKQKRPVYNINMPGVTSSN